MEKQHLKELFTQALQCVQLTCTGESAINLFREYYDSGYFNTHTFGDFEKILCIKIRLGMDERIKSFGTIKTKNKGGFVYLIEANGIYKIGRTISMNSRMQKYCTENPNQKLLHYIPTNDPVKLEAMFHRRYKKKRHEIGKEWYYLEKKDIDFFMLNNAQPSF